MENLTLNRVEVRGRVGQDPRIAKVGEASVARFSVATNEIFKDRNGEIREETTWHNISAWAGKGIADFTKVRKGAMVSLVGRIRNVKYTSIEGEDRHYQEIVASHLDVLGSVGGETAAVH